MNDAPRIRTPRRAGRSGARSCHAPGGGVAARGPPVGLLRSVCGAPAGRVPVLGRFHHRRTPCLCAGFGGPASRAYCGAVTRVWLECVTVFACFSSSSSCQGGMTGHRYLSRLGPSTRNPTGTLSRLVWNIRVRCLVRGCNKNEVSPLLAPPLYAPLAPLMHPVNRHTVPLYPCMCRNRRLKTGTHIHV